MNNNMATCQNNVIEQSVGPTRHTIILLCSDPAEFDIIPEVTDLRVKLAFKNAPTLRVNNDRPTIWHEFPSRDAAMQPHKYFKWADFKSAIKFIYTWDIKYIVHITDTDLLINLSRYLQCTQIMRIKQHEGPSLSDLFKRAMAMMEFFPSHASDIQHMSRKLDEKLNSQDTKTTNLLLRAVHTELRVKHLLALLDTIANPEAIITQQKGSSRTYASITTNRSPERDNKKPNEHRQKPRLESQV